MHLHYYATDLGGIGITECHGRITGLLFAGEPAPAEAATGETPLLREAAGQLREYLAGRRQAFSLPLEPRGTPFMQRVWQALCEIPYGRTASYRDVAVMIGNPGAFRAVGMANNRNPIPVFIPCHRVIGADGSLVGYSGGLEIKSILLELEKRALQ